MSRYSEKMDFGVARRSEARHIVNEYARFLGEIGTEKLSNLPAGEPLEEVLEALRDDLDTPKAIAALRPSRLKEKYPVQWLMDNMNRVYASQKLLGFDFANSLMTKAAASQRDEQFGRYTQASEDFVRVLEAANKIDAARSVKDYEEADRIKALLIGAGVEVQITKEGTKATPLDNFDPSKLEDL